MPIPAVAVGVTEVVFNVLLIALVLDVGVELGAGVPEVGGVGVTVTGLIRRLLGIGEVVAGLFRSQ